MAALDRVRRWPPIAFALAVQQRVGEIGGGVLASAVTLTIFLSLLPMLLVAIAVLGFVSAGDATVAIDGSVLLLSSCSSCRTPCSPAPRSPAREIGQVLDREIRDPIDCGGRDDEVVGDD